MLTYAIDLKIYKGLKGVDWDSWLRLFWKTDFLLSIEVCAIINSRKASDFDSSVKKTRLSLPWKFDYDNKKFEIGIKDSTCGKYDYCDFKIPILDSIPPAFRPQYTLYVADLWLL